MLEQRKDESKLVQFRISKNIKEQADDLFTGMGFDTQTAIRMFLYKAVMKQGMPFEVIKNSSSKKSITAHMQQEGYINSKGETVLPENDEDDWPEYAEYGAV